MRKKIVAGNWKMNTTVPEGVQLAKEVVAKAVEVPSDVKLIIATPATHLVPVAEVVKGSVVGLSAENCADKEKGAYTGEISAAMVASTGAQYTILGHSERRQYYGETDEKLVEKTKLALANGLGVILCVGETLEEREAGKHFDVVGAQTLNVLNHFSAEDMKNIIIAYEPVWAIGTGKTATADQAEEIHAFISLTSSVLRLQTTPPFFTAVLASLQTLTSFSPRATSTAASSEVQPSRLRTSSRLPSHSKIRTVRPIRAD